jgi:hypothetical protein
MSISNPTAPCPWVALNLTDPYKTIAYGVFGNANFWLPLL